MLVLLNNIAGPNQVLTKAFAAAIGCIALLAGSPSVGLADTGFDANTQILKACNPQSNCVSSNYLEPPNRYMSPLRIVNDRDVAFRRAVRDLNNQDLVQVSPSNAYIHLTLPGAAPNSMDDLELLYNANGIVNVRCEARVTLPPPPFCVERNCINGNMDQRRRVEQISRQLGLPPVDQSQMRESAKWSPIFFNSDRVPDMMDNEDEY